MNGTKQNALLSSKGINEIKRNNEMGRLDTTKESQQKLMTERSLANHQCPNIFCVNILLAYSTPNPHSTHIISLPLVSMNSPPRSYLLGSYLANA